MNTPETNQNGIGRIPQSPSNGSSDFARREQEERSFIKLYMEICGATETQARSVYMLHCEEFNPYQLD